MLRLIIFTLLLFAPIQYARSISVTDLPSQLQSCISSSDCTVDTSLPVMNIGQMEAYLFADNLKASPVTGYALRYSLLPSSGEQSNTGSIAYSGDIWLTVYDLYDLTLDSNIVTVYTDKVNPQPNNNVLYGDSNGLDIDISMTNAALLSGIGYEYTGLDTGLISIYQANMNLRSDSGDSALLPCLAEGCLATADMNLIYINYMQSGTTATLQFNPTDNRGLLYKLTNEYNETPENGGFFISQSYYVSAVPIPAAFWLFGSGLLALIGIVRRNKEH